MLQNLVEVVGLENISGMTTAMQLFQGCSSLESIYATSFTNMITSGSMMLYGCNRLVGGTDGLVPQGPTAARVCKLGAITSFAGIANLANVCEMQYAFASCSGITELDFRGFDPSRLTNLYMTFGSCGNLATIYADTVWALPASGLSESQTFYNCSKLVGGNGTAYASSRSNYQYFRIDKDGQVGYLTAA